MEMEMQEVNKEDVKNIKKYAHWWTDKKGVTRKKWAIQDKSGVWWLINGSEFSEKKIKKGKSMSCGLPPTFDFKKHICLIVMAGILGISLAFNIAGLLILLARG